LRQFDVLENPLTKSREYAPYLVVLQSHHLEALDSVVLAPVVRDARRPVSPLDVPVIVNGETLTLAIAELASAHRATFGPSKASLIGQEDEIRRALDRLFTGF
jgi:toxin CcdB